MISVLLPTRDRKHAVIESMRSLRERTDVDLEFLLRFDHDDEDSFRHVMEYTPYPETRIWVGKQHGYAGLHHYVNELCSYARGDWLFLWNDDARMVTSGWGEIVERENGRLAILNPATNHAMTGSCIFPLIPRRMYEILGHFSLNRHNDTWVEFIGRTLGITENIPVEVLHDRVDLTGGHDDQTAKQRPYDPEFFSVYVQDLIAEDAAKLKAEW